MVEMDKIVSGKRGWLTCVNPTYKICDGFTSRRHRYDLSIQQERIEL
jgi:hypothetical protein